jgi:glucuronoxylan 4-O-methyltransferase
MARLADRLAAVYDPACQLAPPQIEVIASCLIARRPAQMLVFGLGRDSVMWQRLNEGGETLFVEHDPRYVAAAAASIPAGRIVAFDFAAHTTVFGSFALDLAALGRVAMPAPLARDWDVILVDGPTGFHMEDPGRALPLYWASRLMQRHTHIFVDDYQRALERHFADLLIRFDNPPCAELPHPTEAGKRMLWRIGCSLPG